MKVSARKVMSDHRTCFTVDTWRSRTLDMTRSITLLWRYHVRVSDPKDSSLTLETRNELNWKGDHGKDLLNLSHIWSSVSSANRRRAFCGFCCFNGQKSLNLVLDVYFFFFNRTCVCVLMTKINNKDCHYHISLIVTIYASTERNEIRQKAYVHCLGY